MKYLYIVAAAGSGKRMGLSTPKQFLEFQGEPIFIKTLKVIEESELVTDIVVVTGEEHIDTVANYCKNFGITKLRNIVSGGKERQDSINNVIKTISNPKDYIIAVQDGVRPFIKEKFIEEAYKSLEKEETLAGVVVGVAVKDTVKVVDVEGNIKDTPERKTLYLAQTPQVFRGEILKEAYEKAEIEGFIGTDDSSLVERLGHKVKIIEGTYDNIKVTTVEDLVHFGE